MSGDGSGARGGGPAAEKRWAPQQRLTLVAGVGAWTLDSFDFFLLVFVLNLVQKTFSLSDSAIALSLTLTLLMRPIGAAIFGPLAEHFGRKPVLVANITVFAVLELLTAASPNYATFIGLRALYGVAMGGVWGVASALTFESVPARARGTVSGVFQAGYPGGYLIASVANLCLASTIGWRGLFVVGAVPGLLAVYIALFVRESPVWLASHARTGADSRAAQPGSTGPGILRLLVRNWRTAVFALVVMAAFNYFSHGSQDLYPDKFLGVQHGLAGRPAMSVIPIVYNVAAIAGGILAGTLSQRFGRKKVIAAFAIAALPFMPLWAGASSPVLLATGAFLVQFAIQGAWGVVPTYLNELFPEGTRASLPGVATQLGNVIASPNANIQVAIAASIGTVAAPNYAAAMVIVTGTVAILLAVVVSFGPETRVRPSVPRRREKAAEAARR